jgi:ribosomal protein S18 acetylase RimI-like enzyme
MHKPIVRPATPSDAPDLRRAVIEMQEYERRLHASRLPGEEIADAYLAWLVRQAGRNGAVLVAEAEGSIAGFAAGWVVQENHIAETAEANRFGYVSDICVMPGFRGRRIAQQLLAALEQHLARAGITRLRLFTLATNASARTSYERAGFVPYEISYEKLVGNP